jgi:nucleoside-diphosphate-sugar epimerase
VSENGARESVVSVTTAIVTGANGFIGGALCRRLAQDGVKVWAVIREGSVPNRLLVENENISVVSCDLRDVVSLPDRINRSVFVKQIGGVTSFDAFFHFAWHSVFGGGLSSDDVDVQLANISHTCKAVEAAAALECTRFLSAGSLMENSCLNALKDGVNSDARTIYYSAKQAANMIAKTMSASLDIDYIAVILANTYGPGVDKRSFIWSTLAKMIRGEATAFTSGDQPYDFLYISDAVEGILAVVRAGIPYHSYYVGNFESRPLKEYIFEMRALSGTKQPAGLGESSVVPVAMELLNIDRLKLNRETGFAPQVSFEEGIRQMITRM